MRWNIPVWLDKLRYSGLPKSPGASPWLLEARAYSNQIFLSLYLFQIERSATLKLFHFSSFMILVNLYYQTELAQVQWNNTILCELLC